MNYTSHELEASLSRKIRKLFLSKNDIYALSCLLPVKVVGIDFVSKYIYILTKLKYIRIEIEHLTRYRMYRHIGKDVQPHRGWRGTKGTSMDLKPATWI